jgi:hypothetical protein
MGSVRYSGGEYKAEFNMAVADLERLSNILASIDEVAWKVRVGELDLCKHYYSLLYQFYANIARFVFPHVRKDISKTFKMIEGILDDKEVRIEIKKGKHSAFKTQKIPIHALPVILDDLYLRLNEIRQFLGLGIPVQKNFKGIKKGS